MTLAELTQALFPGTHATEPDPNGVAAFPAMTAAGRAVAVVAIAGGKPVGADAAIALSGHVLDHLAAGTGTPLVILADTSSQAMSRRDELLGLNEYLAHLTKSLALATLTGHRTVGILHGPAAAGAFIATALSTGELIAVTGAEPSVMDLPSIARVTKLPLERLQQMTEQTPIFAPGLEPLSATGAVHQTWTDPTTYAARFDKLLSSPAPQTDTRDQLGAARRGRLKALPIARLVADAAHDSDPA
jgi:malonate decarboxylase gamma subunit